MADLSRDVIEQVRCAIVDQSPLDIVGGNSKPFFGGKRTGRALDVNSHSGVVSYEPEELVLTARAGTPVKEIQQMLFEQGQMLPSAPPEFDGRATLGGTLACNLSGPSRPWSGSFRDHVLGIRLINGRAEHLRFGGQVMKNVAGYDVSRMQAGAMGIYGVITEISCKVLPLLPVHVTLTNTMLASDAIEFMNQWAGKVTLLTSACWLNGRVYLKLSGVEAAIDVVVSQWQGDEHDNNLWRDLREQQLPFFVSDKPIWRFSVKSSAPHFLPEADWLIDWGGSQRWLSGNYSLAELEPLANQAGGHVCLYRAHHWERGTEIFHSPDTVTKALMLRLKDAFDPHRIFNRGRLYHWM